MSNDQYPMNKVSTGLFVYQVLFGGVDACTKDQDQLLIFVEHAFLIFDVIFHLDPFEAVSGFSEFLEADPILWMRSAGDSAAFTSPYINGGAVANLIS
jgi:hypothetical protein